MHALGNCLIEIVALILLQPEMDKSCRAVKDTAYVWNA